MEPGTTRRFFGHPRALSSLFFAELWERFSYYGMRALLVLFLVEAVNRGGLGLDDRSAAALYGLYTAGVYIASLPGGWIADRLLGAQRAVFWGGLLITLGHRPATLWHRAGRHRAGHRPAQAQHRLARRGALSGRRRTA
jgi:dipeptide/tripeptide permease